MKTKASKLNFIFIIACFAVMLAIYMPIKTNAEETSDLIGDVYTDGKVNSKDAIYMLQYLAYIVEIDEENLYIANAYVEDNEASGGIKINSRDALILLQHLALMDVTLGEGKWQILKAPTMQETGNVKRNTAKGYEELSLPTLNETDYNATITKQPVCFEVGEKNYTYKLGKSNLSFTTEIPKIACKIVTDKAVSPTCTEIGLTEGAHCEMCNKIEIAQKTVPALGHTEIKDEAVEATCTSEGKGEGSHCSVCGVDIIKRENIPMKPHVFSNFKCTVCDTNEYKEYTSYVEYHSLCTVSDNGSTVILTYNSPENIGLNLDQFNLNSGVTYIFKFGSGAGKVKISGNGTCYTNVMITIEGRVGAYDLTLYNVSFRNASTIINSSASLNLGFYGASCSVSTTDGANGANGAKGGSGLNGSIFGYPTTQGLPGGHGQSANTPIICSGTLTITCASNVTLKGGNGGNGGNGGESGDSAGAAGGDGGNGGNGASAISASAVNVYFVNGATKSNISITGGKGGTGGTGGDGYGFSWLGKYEGPDGANGTNGASPGPANVTINYVE